MNDFPLAMRTLNTADGSRCVKKVAKGRPQLFLWGGGKNPISLLHVLASCALVTCPARQEELINENADKW